jgi:hypothetical protein
MICFFKATGSLNLPFESALQNSTPTIDDIKNYFFSVCKITTFIPKKAIC